MLIIGIGGSGGKTLRFIRRDLNQKLLEHNWTGPFPAGWQLIHIDSPTIQDGSEKGLAEDLPERDYVGVAQTDTEYQFYDEHLRRVINQHGGNLEAVAGWLPHPKEPKQRFTMGAGQFRALGRVAYATGVNRIADRLSAAVRSLQDATESHRELTRALGGTGDGGDPGPMALVISSVAGGSGAGMTLDVCDLLRFMSGQDAWLGRSVALLYAPDVFDGIGTQQTAGVAPNALATISELMAGAWDTSANDPSAQAFIESSRVSGSTAGQTQRGPEYSILVGRRNEALNLADQVSVYRAVGTSLAAVATNESVQDQFRAYALGNPQLADGAGASAGVPFIPEIGVKPMSALGFAALGLGRDRFAEYAAERTARMCVQHLLEGHFNDDVRSGRETPEEARDRIVGEDYDLFVGECRLSERSTENNQILDEIRNATEVKSVLGALKSKVKNALAQYGELSVADWAIRVEGQIAQNREDFNATQTAARNEAATAWVTSIQRHVVDTVARKISQRGLAVTGELLRRLDIELADVVGELETEAADNRKRGAEQGSSIRRRLGEWAGGNMLANNPLLERSAQDGLGEFWLTSEADAKVLTAKLVADFRLNFIRPLRDAVTNADAILRSDAAGQPGQPSVYDLWPQTGVPEHMRPAANEFLLEDCDSFPVAYEQKVTQTIGTETFPAARQQLMGEVIAGKWTGFGDGEREFEHPTAITIAPPWIPKEASVRGGEVPQAAAFELSVGLTDILARSRRWVYQDGRPMGMFVVESLNDYFADASHLPAAEVKVRRERFGDLFKKAMTAAAPLVDVNTNVASRLYGRPTLDAAVVMTPLPFESGTEIRKLAEQLLETVGKVPEQAIGSYFEAAPQSRIDITQILASRYDPVVFKSFTSPIRADWKSRATAPDRNSFWRWRRSRSLDKFVPVPPETFEAMVRGWLVGLLLGLVSKDGKSIAQMDSRTPTGRWLAFPDPLLGPEPANSGDRLAALLESIPLAMVEYGGDNEEPAKAYQALADLGEVELFLLRGWIEDGQVLGGMAQPDETVAGPPGGGPEAAIERKDRVLEMLQKTAAQVGRWSEERGPTTDRPASGRAWELESELLAAIAYIEEKARNVSVTGEGGLL